MKQLHQLIAILTLVAFTGCASIKPWYATHKPAIKTTAQVIALRAASIIGTTIFAVATNPADLKNKEAFVQGLQAAFWQQYGNIINSSDIKTIVKAWTPDKPHWDELADKFAQLWAENPPKTTEEAKAFVAAFAKACADA